MVLKGEKVQHRQIAFASIGIIVVGFIVIFSGCANALYEEAEAIRFEATAQTRIPVTPKTPNVSPIDGPSGSGKVLVAWDAVPGTTAYDVYYSSTVSPPALPNGGTNLESISCTVEGLANWNTYYFWIIAKNKLGSSPLSIPPATGQSGIRVTSVTLNKSAATFLVGSQETLTAICLPANATFPNVTWTTNNSGFATVSNGTVTGGTNAGAAIITASVVDGLSASFTATNKLFVANTAGPAGGYLFYDKGIYSAGWRYMEAASSDVGSNHPWTEGILYGYDISGANGTEFGTGKANTAAIVAVVGTGSDSMARDCDNYAQNGYTDWFMPSMNEANQLLFVFSYTYYSVLFSFLSSSQYTAYGCWSFQCFDPIGWSGKSKYWQTTTTVTRPIRQF